MTDGNGLMRILHLFDYNYDLFPYFTRQLYLPTQDPESRPSD